MCQRQGYDNKVSEPFYESLEGLLHDLRTVTMVRVAQCTRASRLFPNTYHQDNHDAEAFLKPVAKSDVPDYYDGACVIRLFTSSSHTTSRFPLGL